MKLGLPTWHFCMHAWIYFHEVISLNLLCVWFYFSSESTLKHTSVESHYGMLVKVALSWCKILNSIVCCFEYLYLITLTSFQTSLSMCLKRFKIRVKRSCESEVDERIWILLDIFEDHVGDSWRTRWVWRGINVMHLELDIHIYKWWHIKTYLCYPSNIHLPPPSMHNPSIISCLIFAWMLHVLLVDSISTWRLFVACACFLFRLYLYLAWTYSITFFVSLSQNIY